MNLYLEPDDIKKEFQDLDPRQVKFEHLTEDVQKVVSKFGIAYLPMNPYVGPYTEVIVPKAYLFDAEDKAGLFKLAKLVVKPGEVVILKGENTIDLEQQIELQKLVQEYFPKNKVLFIAGMDIGVAGEDSE
jgi:hypothetical protein